MKTFIIGLSFVIITATLVLGSLIDGQILADPLPTNAHEMGKGTAARGDLNPNKNLDPVDKLIDF